MIGVYLLIGLNAFMFLLFYCYLMIYQLTLLRGYSVLKPYLIRNVKNDYSFIKARGGETTGFIVLVIACVVDGVINFILRGSSDALVYQVLTLVLFSGILVLGITFFLIALVVDKEDKKNSLWNLLLFNKFSNQVQRGQFDFYPQAYARGFEGATQRKLYKYYVDGWLIFGFGWLAMLVCLLLPLNKVFFIVFYVLISVGGLAMLLVTPLVYRRYVSFFVTEYDQHAVDDQLSSVKFDPNAYTVAKIDELSKELRHKSKVG